MNRLISRIVAALQTKYIIESKGRTGRQRQRFVVCINQKSKIGLDLIIKLLVRLTSSLSKV